MKRLTSGSIVAAAAAIVLFGSAPSARASLTPAVGSPHGKPGVTTQASGDASDGGGSKCHMAASSSFWGMSCGGSSGAKASILALLNDPRLHIDLDSACFYVPIPDKYADHSERPSPTSVFAQVVCVHNIKHDGEKWTKDDPDVDIDITISIGWEDGTKPPADPDAAQDITASLGDTYPEPVLIGWPSVQGETTVTRTNVPTFFQMSDLTMDRIKVRSYGSIQMTLDLDSFTVEYSERGQQRSVTCVGTGESEPEPLVVIPTPDKDSCAVTFKHAGTYSLKVTAFWHVIWRVGSETWHDLSAARDTFPVENPLAVKVQDVQTIVVG